MLSDIKTKIRHSALWQNFGGAVSDRAAVKHWIAAGRPVPVPHPVKVRNIMALADIFGIQTLVKTGTFRGMMIDACLHRFNEIHSIEIYAPLANDAKKHFAPYPHVHIHEGDSGDVLPKILPMLNGPALFWLDGHYSGEGTGLGVEESPVVREIAHIRKARPNVPDVIMVDDARCFNGSGGYPPIGEFVAKLAADFGTTPRVADDAIILMPAR